MFIELKKKLQDNFKELSKNVLFYVAIDRDKIWEEYLNGFFEADRQGNNCNCCKSFLRQYGGIVGIVDGKTVSIWDNLNLDPGSEYFISVENLKRYIHSLPITDVFYNEFAKCGTDKNLGKDHSVVWNHFYIELPKQFVVKTNIDTLRGEKRDNKAVLRRSVNELTLDSVETVLELIAQKSLYRGNEFEGLLNEFLKLKKRADKLTGEAFENFIWIESTKISQALARIRNTAIGTLLIDLSEGLDLDTAVTKFERVVAPTNYKRPTSLVTPKMVKEAKEKLTEMGLLESLERRHANLADIDINNLIFTDKSSELTDVFDEISKDTNVNPKTLSKIEEISIDDFIEKVVPTSKSIGVLLENKHLNNLVSILTAQDKNAPSLFKWNNPFSWSYTGGITDSLKEKVVKAGGRVDGVFRFTHSWNEIEPNQSLMDLHVFMPDCQIPKQFTGGPDVKGRRVGWNSRNDYASGGIQDVDYVNAAPAGYIPVENITFPDIKRMPEGVYTCMIHNWNFRGTGGRGKAEIECEGNLYQYEYPKTKNHEWVKIAEVTLKNGQFTINHALPEANSSTEKWSIKTNTYTKVKQIMLSPNHWENKTGNKHYFFMLENCINDESPRPFFNEFLKEEFTPNRKVFEILGSKVKIPVTDKQLSGVGFSETQRNSLIVKVEGKFKRNLKINF